MKLSLEQWHKLSVLYIQYYACLCSGDFRSQSISRHGIDPQKPEYSIFIIKRVNIVYLFFRISHHKKGKFDLYCLFQLTHFDLVISMASDILVNIGSGNGWCLIRTEPLSGPVLICCQFNTQEQMKVKLKYKIFHHDDVIKITHFPCYWSFVLGIHRSSVNSPHKASDMELWYFLWSAPE